MNRVRLPRALTAVAVAVAATGIGLLGGAAPAQAVTIAVPSAPGSPATATTVAACPIGTSLVGSGGEIAGGGGNVVLSALIPDILAGTVTAIGQENGAYAANWTVSATAICEPMPVPPVLVIAPTVTNSTPNRAVAAVCPAGLDLTGLGYQVIGGNGRVLPQQAMPQGGVGLPSPGAMFFAVENGAYAGNWSLVGYSICANPAGFAPTMIAVAGAFNSVSPKVTATMVCPAGTVLYGVGAMIGPMAGTVTLDQMVPDAAQTFTTARGDEFGAVAAMWQSNAYGMCW